jgi:hypothetical protein
MADDGEEKNPGMSQRVRARVCVRVLGTYLILRIRLRGKRTNLGNRRAAYYLSSMDRLALEFLCDTF